MKLGLDGSTRETANVSRAQGGTDGLRIEVEKQERTETDFPVIGSGLTPLKDAGLDLGREGGTAVRSVLRTRKAADLLADGRRAVREA